MTRVAVGHSLLDVVAWLLGAALSSFFSYVAPCWLSASLAGSSVSWHLMVGVTQVRPVLSRQVLIAVVKLVAAGGGW